MWPNCICSDTKDKNLKLIIEIRKNKMSHNHGHSLFVMKFGKKEYMQKLIDEGLVFFNCTDYFRKSTINEQGDPFEGAGIVDRGKIISYRNTMLNEKLFCLWHLNDEDTPLVDSMQEIDGDLWELTFDTYKKELLELVNTDVKDFHIVFIQNHKEFNNRLRKELDKHYKGRYWSNKVSYYDANTADYLPISPFMKTMKYRSQSELRYIVLDDEINSSKPLEIRIGNMSDIAKIFPMSQVKMQAYIQNS